jgi:hypothetical protein
MSRGWSVVAALGALAFAGCGGGQSGGTPPVTVPSATPSPPSLSVLGYAVQSRTSSQPRVLTEYPLGSTIATNTFAENGGADIRFDPSGTLWSDHIGDFVGYRPDGSDAGRIFGLSGTLRSFDVQGRMYVASCCWSLDVYVLGAANAAALVRSIAIPAFACSSGADGAGNVYLATCTAGPQGRIWNNVVMYGPGASGNAAPIAMNAGTTGPIAVDHAGNVYALYGGGIGEWTAGTFGPGAPSRVLSIASGTIVFDMTADRAGNVYAVTNPGPFFSGSSTLLFFAARSNVATPLQAGLIGSVAAVP